MITYLKSVAYSLGIMLIGTIIITTFNYFNILTGTLLKIISLLIPIIGIFVGSYKIGKMSNKKGYIEGLKYGTIWSFLLLILNLILKSFTVSSLLYLVILILISMFAGVLGINRKSN